MTRLRRTLPSSAFGLALGLSLLAAGPASASQLEGGTIGTPIHSSSTDPLPPRTPADAGSTGGDRGHGGADRRVAPRTPAAPASGPHRGH